VRRGRFQSGPQLEVMGPITKFAAAVEEVGRIPEFVREAARQALTGRIPTEPHPANNIFSTIGSISGRNSARILICHLNKCAD